MHRDEPSLHYGNTRQVVPVTATPLIAGIEIGGSKCICILARSPEDIVEQVRIETRDPATTLNEVDAALERWHGEHRFAAIGLAAFGPLELNPASPHYGAIVSTPKPGWSDTPITSRFARFGVPLALDTDVVGAARAEQRWGAAQGLADFTYITVGTGVGVGALVADRPILGRGNAEMGHMRVSRLAGDDWPGICRFHGDCVEGLACGPAITARHGPGAVAADWPGWATVEHALAMLIHNLVVTLQPQQILIGGGVASGRPSLIDAVRRRALESLAGYYTARDLADDFVIEPGLGTQVGPLGAIALGLSALES
jgi:fructokinase